jgi:hypothetical protein
MIVLSIPVRLTFGNGPGRLGWLGRWHGPFGREKSFNAGGIWARR